MDNWLIRNADIINEGRRFVGDVRVRSGRIDQIGSGLAVRSGECSFDAGGRLLLPGMIDDQVHFREPGLEHKGEFHAESRAAVAGGEAGIGFARFARSRSACVLLDPLELRVVELLLLVVVLHRGQLQDVLHRDRLVQGVARE